MVRFLAALVFLFGSAPAQVSFDLRDAQGRRHTLAEARDSKAIVLLFLGTECPVSNRYAPEIGRLFAEYSQRGVSFYAVYSDPSLTAEEALRHTRDYRHAFPALLDSTQTLARQAGAIATPEAAVISPAGEMLYRGRIDDRVADFGKYRLSPTRQDLRLALDQVLAGKPVSTRLTKAIGCAIPFVRDRTSTGVTFTRHIAPILYRNCVECHRPSGSAPFSLLTHKDAARRASVIAAVTASRYMPPWKPEPGYGKFQGERGLTAAEVSLLRRWSDAGAPEGDPAALPPPPKILEGWRLGPPDRVARLPEPFPVPADGPDLYQCLVIPLGLPEDRYIRAIDFQPQNPQLVHHALFFADPSGAGRERDAAESGPGYRCFGAPGFLPVRGLGGWSPGARPIALPEGAPLVLRKGSDLVVQIHFHPTGKAEAEQSSVGLYFTDTPPVKQLVDIPLGSRNIDIPPGDKSYKVRDAFTIPVDVQAVGIIPHAHYICKDMKGFAVLPDGTKRWLLWIKDWDFNWQDQYHYQSPIRLPAGTRVEMEFTYDNSADNPRNPSHPPRRVTWGMDSTDEMAGLHIQILPERMSDMAELGQALWGKFMRSIGGGFFRLEKQ